MPCVRDTRNSRRKYSPVTLHKFGLRRPIIIIIFYLSSARGRSRFTVFLSKYIPFFENRRVCGTTFSRKSCSSTSSMIYRRVLCVCRLKNYRVLAISNRRSLSECVCSECFVSYRNAGILHLLVGLHNTKSAGETIE